MTTSHEQKTTNTLREINSLKEKRDTLSLEESVLFWKEAGFWYKLKSDFFGNKKSTSWASYLQTLKVPLFTVEFKVALHKKWVKELGYSVQKLKGINSRKLHRAIQYVNSIKDAALVLKKARALPFENFLAWLKKHFSR